MVERRENEKPEKKKRKPKQRQVTRKIRQSIYEKTQGHCYLCGEYVEFKSFEVEHKKPVSKGGTDDFDNLFCSCHLCNKIKNNIFYEDFMEKNYRYLCIKCGYKIETV